MNTLSFTLPDSLAAKAPPERRGLARDGVKLMVLGRDGSTQHSRFNQIDRFLRPGDLLVFNASRTLPAALKGCDRTTDSCLEVRLAHRQADGSWLVLLLCQGDLQQKDKRFACPMSAGMQLDFGQGLTARIEARDDRIPRLWRLSFSLAGTALMDKLHQLGEPIRYSYVSAPWDLDYYQTVYARVPGSVEMPSAGRAFTWQLLFQLKQQGIDIAHIVLHTGLSSYMDDALDQQHPASEEEYFISEQAAEKINRTRQQGGRVIAVGTTVVRALESVADSHARVQTAQGRTRLIITAEHSLKAVDGLLTGMHEPEASHLDLLTAFLPVDKLQPAYEEAIRQNYLWHEFGDLNLIV
ncbi:S-adenosylmethionine:tRNA ribosyltransferase-isomerase [cf. Phormidesmis sp. LEGE 11477]|uniref:S-adenosylmethionine:tRNA ribosyltransferase-isomerase n=1 Tax=cf. Phormidesmis sp. LEGE 11477 TaxID=1828680 RepID=UPI00187FEB3A|nr:S-adenosylmethionine:tRNA ribosyltransferase-isomerase [cf. Phormidesmis sp. LEGE 11477]MBE9064363.1 S-adenosylmethionine:tRNA ribosyltransferase-isomerase [cf. Phormidesmis sp. LEGE 11477]